MKALKDLSDKERAKLLHQLFPDQIPALIQQIESMCAVIRQDEKLYRAGWDNGLFTFDFWLWLAGQVETRIHSHGRELEDSSSLFSQQLFDGYLPCLTNECIRIYATVRKHSDANFIKAIDLLFDLNIVQHTNENL